MAEQHLVTLLVKVAVAAALASLLVRFPAFKRILLTEERSIGERGGLALALTAVFGGALVVRLITGNTYKAADVGLEGCLIAGIVGGYVPGLLCGVLISIPAMIAHEYLSMPLFAAVGVLGGMVRDAAPDPEQVWSISPFLDRNLYKVIRHHSDRPATFFRIWFLMAIILAEAMRFLGSEIFRGPGLLFHLYPDDRQPGMMGAVWLSTMFAVLIPIRIWAAARTELRLEEQRRLAQEAQLRALTSQINPHFLFNTLNSITSLVRTNPDVARQVILKLSSILRRLLRRGSESFTPLREDLSFIDDYMSIEQVRFGEKLRFIKDIEEGAREAMVPSMVLQPIIENSLKHGLAAKVEGGTIRLRAWQAGPRLHLLVEDDGVGIPEANLAKLFEQGIGISNVKERLQVLFGNDYRMWIDSKPGEGTRTGIEFPARLLEPSRPRPARRAS